MNVVRHSRPWITADDRQAILAVLDSEMIAQGEETRRFEVEFAGRVNAHDGVALSSGSSALVLALRAIEAEQTSEIVIPTYVCRSVLEAVIAVGAKPVLADCGAQWVVTPASVAPLVSRRTAAIVVPHICGVFADIPGFREFGVPIIEDCAQAIGGVNDHADSGTLSVFSFHATKCLTTGEGGLVCSKDPQLLARARAIRDGDASGSRARLFAPLADILAALGRSQLSRYDTALVRRKAIAQQYVSSLTPALANAIDLLAFERSMHFRFLLKLTEGFSDYETEFARQGVTVRRGVDMLNHRSLGLPDEDFPMAVELYKRTLSLPIYPAMGDAEVRQCLQAAKSVLLR